MQTTLTHVEKVEISDVHSQNLCMDLPTKFNPLLLCCETPNKGPLIPRMMKSEKQGKSMDLSYKEFYATLIFKHSDWLFKFL